MRSSGTRRRTEAHRGTQRHTLSLEPRVGPHIQIWLQPGEVSTRYRRSILQRSEHQLSAVQRSLWLGCQSVAAPARIDATESETETESESESETETETENKERENKERERDRERHRETERTDRQAEKGELH